jgi:hypothetical protein
LVESYLKLMEKEKEKKKISRRSLPSHSQSSCNNRSHEQVRNHMMGKFLLLFFPCLSL